MPGNRDRQIEGVEQADEAKQADDVKQRHKKKIKRGGGIALFLFAFSGLIAAGSDSRKYAELIEEGAGHIDRMRPGFDAGNFTIIPREDLEHEKRCDGVNQAVRHGLANNQTQETVGLLCSESMWRFASDKNSERVRVSDETPCKVDVALGTNDEQIAELNVLNSVCKTLAGTFDFVVYYSVGFSMAALSLLYSLYHGKKVFWSAQPEEQPLLEERRQREGEGSFAEESAEEGGNSASSYQNEGQEGVVREQEEGAVREGVYPTFAP